jgi:hypothetical protein
MEILQAQGAQNVSNSLGERGWSLQQQEEDEVTESKIRAFLDEKASELKRLQTPLQEEVVLRGSRKVAIPGAHSDLCSSCFLWSKVFVVHKH